MAFISCIPPVILALQLEQAVISKEPSGSREREFHNVFWLYIFMTSATASPC